MECLTGDTGKCNACEVRGASAVASYKGYDDCSEWYANESEMMCGARHRTVQHHE